MEHPIVIALIVVVALAAVRAGVVLIRTRSSESLAIDSKWNNYRLGDVLRGPTRDWGSMEWMNAADYHTKYFKGSIAAEYVAHTNKKHDLQALEKAIQRVCPANSQLGYPVVHLRIGDAVDKELIKNPGIFANRYVAPEEFRAVAKDMYGRGVRRVRLVAGIHTLWAGFHRVKVQDSIDYIRDVQKVFGDHGILARHLPSRSPDSDFCLLANADEIVGNINSGFFQGAALVVQSRKKKTIEMPPTIEGRN